MNFSACFISPPPCYSHLKLVAVQVANQSIIILVNAMGCSGVETFCHSGRKLGGSDYANDYAGKG